MISNKLLLKLQQKLSPQQIQLMKLLQLPALAMEQRIKEELEINPTLEEDYDDTNDDNIEIENSDSEGEYDEVFGDNEIFPNDDDFITFKNNNTDSSDKSIPIISESSFYEDLINQLQLQSITEQEKLIGLELIGNLDDSGYLSRSITSMVDDFLFRQNIEVQEKEIEKVLGIIQSLDPAGIGARDLKECLLLQLKRKEQTKEILLSNKIINRCFDFFLKKQYHLISQKLNCSEDELEASLEEILKLNPKPANSQSTQSNISISILPDFIIWQNNSRVEFRVNKCSNRSLKTNSYYQNLMDDLSKSNSKKDNETYNFLKEKLESANTFIDSLQKRNETLFIIMKAIIDFQYNYFIDGDVQKLKPMRLVDIADKVGMDVSTISRVISSKYAQTHFGIFKLKDFFSNFMINDQGEAISTDAIKNVLSLIIGEEDKTNPLNDDQLVEILKQKGYSIARRTVAKYRETLDIPVARLRKQIN